MWSLINLFQQVRNLDRSRASFPGEHWLMAAAAVKTLSSARRRHGVGAAITVATGVLMLARAFSGRDSIPKRLARRR